MPAVFLKLINVSKVFSSGRFKKEEKVLFTSVNLDIGQGETLGIMGNSGAGKSTLGRIIVGLEPPSSGRVLYGGKEMTAMNERERRRFRRSVQVLFQDPGSSLNPRKTLERSLYDVLALIGCPKNRRLEVLQESLSAVGLGEDVLGRYPGQLSGGMNQRAALARVLLLEPDLIVLDEPISALDLPVQAQILYLLKRLQEERGLSYVFISHDEAVVEFMSHRRALLKDGKLHFQVTVT